MFLPVAGIRVDGGKVRVSRGIADGGLRTDQSGHVVRHERLEARRRMRKSKCVGSLEIYGESVPGSALGVGEIVPGRADQVEACFGG